jgi:hypothetical protein
VKIPSKWLRVIPALIACVSAAAAAAPKITSEPTETSARPLSVAGVVLLWGDPIRPMGGVDVAYLVSERIALDAQLTSMVLDVNDLSAGARFFFVRGRYGGPYLGISGHYFAGRWSFDGRPTIGGEVGVDGRTDSGTVFDIAAGYVPLENVSPGVVLTFRLGKAF